MELEGLLIGSSLFLPAVPAVSCASSASVTMLRSLIVETLRLSAARLQQKKRAINVMERPVNLSARCGAARRHHIPRPPSQSAPPLAESASERQEYEASLSSSCTGNEMWNENVHIYDWRPGPGCAIVLCTIGGEIVEANK